MRWADLIDTYKGNRIIGILRDTRGNYWLGGISGLGCYLPQKNESIFWEKDGDHQILNNRIRTIYEDKEGRIWIGSDGGVAWLDRRTQTFVPCVVEDRESGRNAVWTYGITEDREGHLWLATCSGGIFVVDKQKVLQSRTGKVPADFNYHADTPGLKIERSGCIGVVLDSFGSVWVNGEHCLYRIERAGQKAKVISGTDLGCWNILGLFCDREGFIWGFSSATFFRIDPKSGDIEKIPMEDYTSIYGNINSIAERGKHIWFLTDRGVGVLDKRTLKTRHLIDFSTSEYKSCYYDAREDRIWLGGIDNCLVVSPAACLVYSKDIPPEIILSEAYVNDKISVDRVFDREHIRLGSDENSIAFRVSFGVPMRETEMQQGYYYRLKGLEERWTEFKVQEALIKYPYLEHGLYELQIGKQDWPTGKVETVHALSIDIEAPWYYTLWFKFLMFLLIASLFLIGINSYRLRTKLHIAENEKANMLKLSQMKMDFLVNVSHELKTPLSLILGPVNHLLSTVRSPQTKAQLQMIYRNVSRLSVLVRRIVDFKGEENEESDLVSLTQVEVVEFMQSVLDSYREGIEEKGVKVEFMSNVQTLYVETDVLKLESIVSNLLSNAYKFTGKGGSITLTLDEVPAVNSAESILRFCVTDTGIGIPKEELSKVFERFYQVSNSQEMNPDGSGIGLAVVKGYVEKLGGQIEVESEEGRGTTFTVSLPLARAVHALTIGDQPTIEEDEFSQLKVLIVEDNVEIARFIADNLRGMLCQVAHNGRSGYDCAIQWMPDIIVADVRMPVMDGVEMSKLLKKNVKTKTIPLILLTANDNRQTELEAYQSGADAFLSKPFELDYLAMRIRQLVEIRRSLLRKSAQAEPDSDGNILVKTDANLADSADEKLLADITRLIEEHLEDSELNVQKLADLSGLNNKQIYRKLKQLTGSTAVDYIKQIRLKKAALLLKQGNFTVSEVMYMVGFSNSSYFAKCFFEKYGVTPKAYREERRL